MIVDQPSRLPRGVGVAYHPFLHAALAAQRDSFDFLEMPVDLYLDPARSALLDPFGSQLRAIAAGKPCFWSGTALSLGSADDAATPDPTTIDRMRALFAQTGSAGYTDAIGFRRLAGFDFGSPQHMPHTPEAARWITARQAAAADALGCPVTVQPPPPGPAAPPTGTGLPAFLRLIAGRLCLDAADVVRLAAATGGTVAAIVAQLPCDRVTALAMSGEAEEDWVALALLAAATGARSITIRRDRALFPHDTITRDARRAAGILSRLPVVSFAPGRGTQVASPCADELAALRGYQQDLVAFCRGGGDIPATLAGMPADQLHGLASQVRAWQNWRRQVDDAFKARQIADFLARRAGPRQRAGMR